MGGLSFFVICGLSLIVLLVLVLPLTVKKIEENIEIFLFVCGVAALTIVWRWDLSVVKEAALAPVPITIAVLVLGLLFQAFEKNFRFAMLSLVRKTNLKITLFILALFLSLFSSIMTAIVAAIMLSEAVGVLGLRGKSKTKFVVLSCFAIGLGAVLTPLGEPLSTIAVSKLKDGPHDAGFWFLLRLLGVWIIPGVIIFSILASRVTQKRAAVVSRKKLVKESRKSMLLRVGKVYFFVAALVFLGAGLKPLAEITVFRLAAPVLYWANSVSAVLDNATLAAIEIVPHMSAAVIKFLLMGLVLAGGLLVPGNIPNIISASKLKIRSGEWARVGIPYGAAAMSVYFILMTVFVQ